MFNLIGSMTKLFNNIISLYRNYKRRRKERKRQREMDWLLDDPEYDPPEWYNDKFKVSKGNEVMRYLIILIITCSLALAGALAGSFDRLTTDHRPVTPDKPKIKMTECQDGKMCMDKQDAKELGTYIIRLEQAVERR